ncbi:MAG: alpha/beta fold hydrolase [Burkholderiaceae bacterium]|nr:alpha/beta fold hydrolase [Burkholderiaceae bacterium]
MSSQTRKSPADSTATKKKAATKATTAASPAKRAAKPAQKSAPASKSKAAKPAAGKAGAARNAAKPSAKSVTAPKAAAKPKVKAGGESGLTGDRLSDTASKNTLAINPMMGLRAADLGEAAKAFFGATIKQPMKTARHLGEFYRELGQAVAGMSDTAPDPKDRRFADPAWQSSPLHKRLMQAHAITGKELARYIDATGLNARDKARAHLAASIFVDTISPSNTLMNPSALKRAVDTSGVSLLKGVKNLVHDLRHNDGLPSSVDKSKFKLGKNIALSQGKVVFTSEVLEVIQYQPKTETVFQRPLVVIPPQVNKFYAMDLSPEKSMFKFATEHGLQLFAISWRNPKREHRDWDISTYVNAVEEAVEVARQITGSADVNLWGACSGGITLAAYVAWLAATGQQDKVKSVVSPVCVLDPTKTMDTTMGLLITDQSIMAVKAAVKRRGFVDGAELARTFAWLRPNDLIWNYWVNNYLMGNDPPAFDILFWNADTTRLPAAFHANLVDTMLDNPFAHPGALEVLDEPIDMGKVKVDAYIVAGITDHITPWKACYETARLYGGNSTFTLANAGHLQSLLNPPGSPKSFFFSRPAAVPDPDAWAESAERVEGSWWPHWMAWMHQRSGERVPAPKKLGSRKHKPGVDAPGLYVLEP